MPRHASPRTAHALPLVIAAASVAAAGAAPVCAGQQGAAPATRPQLGSILDVETTTDLPSSGNLFNLLGTTQPDIISDRFQAAGLNAGQAARVGAHGSSWTQTTYRIDDVTITDPRGTGAPLFLPELGFWRRIVITTGMMPADIDAPGLAVSLEPLAPASAWTGSADGWFTGSSLVAGSPTAAGVPAIVHLDSSDQIVARAAGPIVPGRLGLAAAGSWTRASQFDRGGVTPFDSTFGSGFANVVFSPTAADEIRTVVAVQHVSMGERSTSAHVQSTWHRQTDDGGAWRVFGSFTGLTTHLSTTTGVNAVVDAVSGPPAPTLAEPLVSTDRRWSIGARSTPAPRAVFGVRHSTRAGIDVERTSTRDAPSILQRVGELVDGVPARLYTFMNSGVDAHRHATVVAVHAADHIEIVPRLDVEAGIRFEAVSGSADSAPDRVRWTTWLPRFEARLGVADTARIALFGGYSRSAYQLPLDWLAYGDPAAPTANVFRWIPPSGTPTDLATTGPLIARLGPGTGTDPGFSRIDPELVRPMVDEAVAGIESSPARQLRLRFAGIAKRETHLVAAVDTGVPVSAYARTGVRDPGLDLLTPPSQYQTLPVYNRLPATFAQDRYLLTNPSGDTATYTGLDFTVEASSRRLWLLGGATAVRGIGPAGYRGYRADENDQGVIGELYIDPNAATNARGRVFVDRAYTIKLAGVYRFPGDVRLGVIARYQDGQPFSRLVIVSGLNQGPEAIRAFPTGGSRFTYTMTIDARLQKALQIGAQRLVLMVEAYNLLNQHNEVEEFVVSGAAYRTPTAVQPPRTFRAGLGFRF